MTDVLAIHDLSIDFSTPLGTVHAVRHVDLNIPPNRIVGIVGESGCGKSTVASSAIRLLPRNAKISSGQVLLGDRDVFALSNEELREVRGRYAAMVFQDPMTAQNPVISISRQMIDIQYRELSLARRQKKERAVAMLRRVGIPDPERRIDDFPHQFSGGMRQRVSIAMALLMKPKLLIADEPTTALDVNTEAQVVHLLHQLQQESGAGMLFVSHNLGLVSTLCDEVVVMYAGEIVERGTTEDLFRSPQHPYTQRLLECDPVRAPKDCSRLPTIRGRVPDLRKTPSGCVFEPRCDKALELCKSESPEAFETSISHRVRCHLASGKGTLPRSQGADEGPQSAINIETKPPRESLLEIDNLRVRFRTEGFVKALIRRNSDPYIDAVLQVSLQLYKGETFGLVGESGSGKTTLGRSILGLVQPQSGSIRFDGSELVGLSNAQYNIHRRKVSMMFQDPVASLSPRQKARALVMEPFSIHGVHLSNPEAVAEHLFSLVGLSPDFFESYPHELSGGQARRVGAARSLALSPKLVVADEPTAGLDVSVQGEILNLMRDLQRQEGLSYLIISHNLPAIRHVSDRIGVMYLGRLVEQGPAIEIFEAPAHPYTRALVLCTSHSAVSLGSRDLPLEGEVPSLVERPQGCEFHPRCPFAQGKCRIEAPGDRSISPERRVRCHFPLA